MPYYQEGCNISVLTLPKVLIAIPCEKNQKETLGRKIARVTGPADRSDRSDPTASLFELTGVSRGYMVIWWKGGDSLTLWSP